MIDLWGVKMSRTSKKKKSSNNEQKNSLSSEILKCLYELAEEGHKLTHEEKYMEAIHVWNKAIELIPEPKLNFFETANFYEGIAYNYQMMNLFTEAMDYMNKALRCWGDEANQNAFTLRNLGEIYYELGDMEHSLDYLRKAYNLEGDEIFYSDGYGKIDHNKYFKILKKKTNLE